MSNKGRKELLPGEVPDSVLNVPKNKKYQSPLQHTRSGVKQSAHRTGGTAPVEAVELPDDALAEFLSGPMTFSPEAEYKARTLVPKNVPHSSEIFNDAGVWVWICEHCNDGGEGTQAEVRAAARHHKLTS